MKTKILIATAILGATLWSQAAHAKAGFPLRFGTDEQVRILSEKTISGPEGKQFRIGHLVVTRYFGLPYSISSNGYVLSPAGESSRYIPLYEGDRLAKLQALGVVPKTLPAATLNTVDYLWGHALWVALVAAIGWIGVQSGREKGHPPRSKPLSG